MSSIVTIRLYNISPLSAAPWLVSYCISLTLCGCCWVTEGVAVGMVGLLFGLYFIGLPPDKNVSRLR